MNSPRSRQWLNAAVGAAALFGLSSVAATAGPPFLTDDPEPTETGHWEIYAPAVDVAGRGGDYEGSAGAEINYGAAPNLQLTIGLPANYVHDSSGLRTGRGDIKLSAKYRFYRNEEAGLSIAAFPGLAVPTASHAMGSSRLTGFIPVWAQKDFGPWSIFGGGGYAINPGPGARNYWTGGAAVSREISKRLQGGIEVNRQGADAVDGHASTSLGLGAILQLKGPVRLLASAGPSFEDGQGGLGFHGYMALGMDF